jgi:hypothetical protein
MAEPPEILEAMLRILSPAHPTTRASQNT